MQISDIKGAHPMKEMLRRNRALLLALVVSIAGQQV